MLNASGAAVLVRSFRRGNPLMAYAATAIGFGIVVGILFMARGETAPGLGMLGLAIFIAALIVSPAASARVLILSIATGVCGTKINLAPGHLLCAD